MCLSGSLDFFLCGWSCVRWMGKISRCSDMFAEVGICSGIFGYVFEGSDMFVEVRVCLWRLGYVAEGSLLLVEGRLRWLSLGNVTCIPTWLCLFAFFSLCSTDVCVDSVSASVFLLAVIRSVCCLRSYIGIYVVSLVT